MTFLRKHIRLTLLLCLVFCLSWAVVEPHLLRITTHQISSERLPKAWDQVTIALVADLHIGRYTKTTKLKQVITHLERLKPDIIVLAGDYVYQYQGNYNDIFAPFKPLTTHTPVFAVSGNHDHFENYHAIMQSLSDNRITVLDHQSQPLIYNEEAVLISGIPDLWHPRFSSNHLPNAKPSQYFHILVSHNPDFLVEHPAQFDLGLAGHTHGGQVTVFGHWAPLLPIEHKAHAWRGHVQFDNSDIIITNGIGTSLLPFRFFAPPEISLITLNPSAKTSTM